MKTFVTLFYLGLKNTHLTKDVGLIPYYMNKTYKYKSIIVTPLQKNHEYEDLDKYLKGLIVKKIISYRILFINYGIIRYIIKDARKIDILNIYHFSLPTLLYGLLYKLCNRNGKLYLKMDFDIKGFKNNGNRIYNFGSNLINLIFKPFENLLIKISHTISIEVKEGIQLLIHYNKKFIKKLVYIPNGADDINIGKIINKINKPQGKENLMITVGRIGTYQKNTEMLLEIIKKLNLKNWKIKIIGPIEENFLPKIQKFFLEYPHLKNKVEFTGPKSKIEVYNYYNRARLFLLTSRWEGFANIFPEAIYFGNYIITTDVSGADDITNKGQTGDIIPLENTKADFICKLQYIIDNSNFLEDKYESIINLSRDYFVRSKIIKNIGNKVN